MSEKYDIDIFLDDFVQLKVRLEQLIIDYQQCVNNKEYDANHNRALFILKNKYEMLDLISSEIRYLTADRVRDGMR